MKSDSGGFLSVPHTEGLPAARALAAGRPLYPDSCVVAALAFHDAGSHDGVSTWNGFNLLHKALSQQGGPLTKVRRTAYSCNPYGESLLQLQVSHGSQLQSLWRIPAAAVGH